MKKNMHIRKKYKNFIQTVNTYYKNNRRDFPWRKRITPYRVFISEIMLQQTQADRVVPYFKKFIRTIPSITALSDTSLKEVLSLWQGLGYNRRARYILLCAKSITEKHAEIFPKERSKLEALPGIGPYTAGAIRVFAYNKPEVFIETNIRTVYLHHFFKNKNLVSDSEILPHIEATLDIKNPREWYSALMDYGAYLKQIHPNPSRKSKHHVTQSVFKGSNREIRGKIIAELTKKKLSIRSLCIECDRSRVRTILNDLVREGLVQKKKSVYFL